MSKWIKLLLADERFGSGLVEVITILIHVVVSLITRIVDRYLEHIVLGLRQITIMRTGVVEIQIIPALQEQLIMKV